jgi:hemoglobin-like flavoprotein
MYHMDARRIVRVQDSFEKVAAIGPRAAEIFYEEFFALDPSLRAMFNDNMEVQQRKLLAALGFIARSLHAPEKFLSDVEKLAVRHVGYGVRLEQYNHFGNALLRTLKKTLGPEFTPELCDAWRDAFRMVTRCIKEAAYEGAPAPMQAAR